MAKTFYVGENDIARNVKQPYAEVGGVARGIKKAYIGINDVGRVTYSSAIKGWFTFHTNLYSIDFRGNDWEWYREYHEFPFTTLEGMPYNSIYLVDDGMAGASNNKMWFGRNPDPAFYEEGTLIYSTSDFWSGQLYGWKGTGFKSIYLDELELGVDISQEAYDFLLKAAYLDNTLGGKPQTYTLEAGRYTFNEEITSGGLFSYDWNAPVISIPMTFTSQYDGFTFAKFEYRFYFDLIESCEIDYVQADGTSHEAYNCYYDYSTDTTRRGWIGAWKWLTIVSDVQVSKSVFDWWTLNTQKGYIY